MIELTSVGKIYETLTGPVAALHGVGLSVGSGEYLGIVGPRAAGKTTLFNLMGCLDVPTSGTLTFMGTRTEDLDDTRLSRLRSRFIGHLFSDDALVPGLSVLENVELPLRYGGVKQQDRRARALDIVEDLGIGQFADQPAGLLPSAARRRAALARALVNDPGVILADDPVSALDPGSGADLLNLLSDVHARGKAVVLFTADVTTVAAAQRVAQLSAGTIVSIKATTRLTATHHQLTPARTAELGA